MKKLLAILSIVTLSVLLGACGNETTTKSETTTVTSNLKTSTVTKEQYSNCNLTYAAWDLGSTDSETPNMDRYMLKAFEEAYPGIKVNIVERPKVPGTTDNQNWDEFLTAKASVGALPDVFQPDDIPLAITNEWALDLKNYVKDDAEYNSMSTDVTGAATYSGHVMAIPQSIFYMGFLVNNTLYEKANLDAPTVNTTYDELMSLTEQAANQTSKTGNGIVGITGIEHILHWLPAQYNTALGWWTYDGTKFNLDGSEFTKAVEAYRTLRTSPNYCLEALQDKAGEDETIDLEAIFGTTDYVNNEKILCSFVYSYSFGEYQTKIDNATLKSDYSFIGTPVVNNVKRVPIVLDFLCVSSTTEHPREAYLLAKWMGFCEDGYAKRLELGEQYSKSGMDLVNYPPMTDNADQLKSFFEIYSAFTTLKGIIEKGTYIVEPPKYLPGYNSARYSGTYDAESNMYQEMIKIMSGEVKIGDVKTQLNERANALIKEQAEKVATALKKLG